MKLILCTPNTPKRPNNTHDLFSLGLLYLKNVAESCGWECAVVDAYFLDLTAGETAAVLEELIPGELAVMGFMLNSQSMAEVAEFIVATLGASGRFCAVIAGGHYPTILKQGFLTQHPVFDAAVIGEGEHTLRELLGAIEHGASFGGIRGLVARDASGNSEFYGARSPQAGLDEFGELQFSALATGRSHFSLVTSRGCTSACTYCLIGPHWKRFGLWRGHSAAWIESHLRRLAETGVEYVNLVDDQFLGHPESISRAKELVKAFREKPLGLEFGMMCRADTVVAEPDIYRSLAEVGLTSVFIGLESGCEEHLVLWKKGTTPAVGREAIRILDEAGIVTSSGTIVFHPDATLGTLLRDVDYFRSLMVETKHFHLYGINEIDLFHGLPAGSRFPNPDKKWRIDWEFGDRLLADLYQRWLKVQTTVLFPALLAASEHRGTFMKRVFAEWQLNALEQLVHERERPFEEVLNDLHLGMCGLLNTRFPIGIVIRFMTRSQAPDPDEVAERCFDL